MLLCLGENNMKKILIILGSIFAILILVGVIGFSVLAVKGTALDEESKQYAEDAIVSIISGWDKQEIIKRASPEFIAAATEEGLDKVFGFYRKLGELREYKNCEG